MPALHPITEIAAGLGLAPDDLVLYGPDKAKLAEPVADRLMRTAPRGPLVLVTAMTPTGGGEGKTTTAIGLADALVRRGRRAALALREPSLGPVFGGKGGGAGGGLSTVEPALDINLHFTGDLHAVAAANNLLAAALDNHLHHGNVLGLDPRRLAWRRCLDVDDRALRNVIVGLGGPADGVPREEHFDITAASEVMAILAVARDRADLYARLGRVIVGFTGDRRPVTAADLRMAGAMATLLRDALQPNLVQTAAGTPAFVHAGPFANLALGTNSIRATRAALALADITITEAGFAADLGAEKFCNVVAPVGGFAPALAVVVASGRACKAHALDPGAAGIDAVRAGSANLRAHVEIVRRHGLTPVVAINRFPADSAAELAALEAIIRGWGVRAAIADPFAAGAGGCLALADAVLDALAHEPGLLRPLYPPALPVREKIETVARVVYGAAAVAYDPAALHALDRGAAAGMAAWPVCMAKTPLSLSDDPARRGRPTGFTLRVRDIRPQAGAGYLVALAGDIRTMPGLPAEPAAIHFTAAGPPPP